MTARILGLLANLTAWPIHDDALHGHRDSNTFDSGCAFLDAGCDKREHAAMVFTWRPKRGKAAILPILLLMSLSPLHAQNWMDHLDGPFHRPTEAVDEFGNSLPPLLVYKDEKVETYIPDFTGTYDSITKPALFKQDGEYEFIIYTYYKDTHKTNRSLVVGNAQTGEIHLHKMDQMGGLFGPVVDYHKNKGLPHYLDQTILAYMKLMVYLHKTEGGPK